MNWANDFLEQCLSGIPEGKYSARLRKELESHLAALKADLTAAGHAPEEARAEAVRRMGDPAALNESFRAEWRRRPERLMNGFMSGFEDFMSCLYGSVLAWSFYVVLFVGIALLRSLPEHEAWSGASQVWILACVAVAWLLGFGIESGFPIGMFLWPYGINALFLRAEFRWRENARTLITAGLLLTWAGEKAAILLLGSMGTGIPLTEPLKLIDSISRDPGWFTAPYWLCSLAGCFLFGWLFGGKKRRKAVRAN